MAPTVGSASDTDLEVNCESDGEPVTYRPLGENEEFRYNYLIKDKNWLWHEGKFYPKSQLIMPSFPCVCDKGDKCEGLQKTKLIDYFSHREKQILAKKMPLPNYKFKCPSRDRKTYHWHKTACGTRLCKKVVSNLT